MSERALQGEIQLCEALSVICESPCGGSTERVLDWAQGDAPAAAAAHLLSRGLQTALTAAVLLRVHVFILLNDTVCVTKRLAVSCMLQDVWLYRVCCKTFGCIVYVAIRLAVSCMLQDVWLYRVCCKTFGCIVHATKRLAVSCI